MRSVTRTRWMALAALAAAFLVVAAACAPQQTAQTPQAGGAPKPAASGPQKGGTLRIGFDGETGGFDGTKLTGAPMRRFSQFVFNTLTRPDEKGEVVPELAESWSTADNKTWTFKLRKGVKFQDGTDFNAQAAKFNFDRAMRPESPATYRGHLTTAAGITSVEVVDDNTIKFSLKESNAGFPAYLTHNGIAAMYSPAGIEKWGDQFMVHPVGTGPYELVEWVKGDHLTFKRFDGYWRKDDQGNPLPNVDQLIIRPIADETVRLNALRAGDLDLVDYVGPSDVPTVNADSSLKSVTWGNTSMSLILNAGQPPFDNKALRQAMAWAVDREAIHKAIYSSTGAPANSMLDPNNWAFDGQGKFYGRDVAKAKAKLAEGGKPNGFKFQAQNYNTPIDIRVAEVMKGQLAEAGIDMEIVPNERQTQSNMLNTKKFDAAFSMGYGMPEDPDIELTRSLYKGGAYNFGNYSNPEIESLLDKARQAASKDERKSLYAKIQAIYLDESPRVYIHHNVMTTAMKKTVGGFVPNIDLMALKFDWVWLQK